jgi:hypothetical protein
VKSVEVSVWAVRISKERHQKRGRLCISGRTQGRKESLGRSCGAMDGQIELALTNVKSERDEGIARGLFHSSISNFFVCLRCMVLNQYDFLEGLSIFLCASRPRGVATSW